MTISRFRFGPLAFCLIGLLLFFQMGRAEDTPTPAAASSLMTPKMRQELFDALDLTQPGLEAVQAAVSRHDLAVALAELARYFRTRTSVPWKFDPHAVDHNVPYNKQKADDAVLGRVQPDLLPLWHSFPDGKIDWFYNATFHTPGEAPNTAWQLQLVRMAWWTSLGSAYRATGDERYAQAWVRQFRSFAAQCPVVAENWNADGSAWRTLETGIRMSGSWPEAYHSFLLSPSFTDADLLLFLYLCREHAQFLEAHNTGGNWITMEMSGLYTVGALFPEFKQAREWRDYAFRRMSEQESIQLLPDGAQFELATGYHTVAIDNFLILADIAKLTGRVAEIPRDYITTLQKSFDYDMYMMTPDRFLPHFNDSWYVDIKGPLRRALQYFPRRKDYLWLTSDGKKGKPPVETSHQFPWAGYYVMRSGWDREANYLIFRAGPLGAGHQHQDCLNLLIWPFGRELLFGSSGGSYEVSKWRTYATSTYAANSVIIDGLTQMRPMVGKDPRQDPNRVSPVPIDAHWQSTPVFDFASGTYASDYGRPAEPPWSNTSTSQPKSRPATHHRDVLFLKPDLYVVADRLVPNDTSVHQYQARWQLLTTQSRIDPSTDTLVTTDPGRPNLAIVPLLGDGLTVTSASAQELPDILGWNVRKDMAPEYVPATTLLHTRQGTGVQNFLTLFLPLKAGAPNPVTSVKSTGPGAALVTLADGRQLAITADLNPSGSLEATETLADGSPGRHVKAGESHP
ncbi:MAG: heparinase II/III family protein [Methylacidiphilales bacterium]|nr:heparinase II/III family protein [Candidatus Methylacidiphilales bacterium]